MTSVKKNFAYSSFLTVSNYIINLIIFPYCARVLGVEKFGAINFTQNIVQYFLFIAMMGITHIGVREIAKQTTREGLNKCYSSMLALNSCYTFISLIIYIPLILLVKRFFETQTLFFLGGLQILFTQFTVEWFFRGIEDFQFITIRNIFVKVLYVVNVFIFVKNPDDYVIFFMLTVLMTIATALINFIYAQKKVRFSIRDVNIREYLKSTLSLGAYSILTSMYTTFNVAFLGFVYNDIQVGYYTTALKLYTIILGFYSAFTSVMLPRMTSLIGLGDDKTYQSFITKSFQLLLTITLPLTIILFILAPEIIMLLAGKQYIASIGMSRIVIPLLFVVGIAQILSFQVLLPKGYDKITLYASVIGATVGVISNLIFTVKFAAIGTCITIVITEISVTTFYLFITLRKRLISLNSKLFFKHLLLTIPYVPLCAIPQLLFSKSIILISIVSLLLCLIYFILSQIYILKNDLVVNTIAIVINRLKR